MKSRIGIILVSIAVVSLINTHCAYASTFMVYPAGKGNSENGDISGFSKIPWDKVLPGDIMLLSGAQGIYYENLIIPAKGESDKPITVKSIGGSAEIKGSVILSNSEYVTLEGVTISKSAYSGVIIKDNSNHITVSGCIIKNNALGIWIGDNAGDNNRIIENRIFGNKTHGIAIDVINCTEGNETFITGNKVYDSGYHGMEINGSYYIIEGNEVYRNGQGISGASGIHIYAKNADQDAGDHNIICYNFCYENKDSLGQDGNGIQLDQWCDFNEVYYNICRSNDGAGINNFDGANNNIFNNTLFGNMLDPGKSHAYKAELVLASDFVNNVNRVNDINVMNNIIVANNYYAIYIDDLTSKNKLLINNNLFFQARWTKIYYFGGKTGDINLFNKLTAASSKNFNRSPGFVKNTPVNPDDFKLRSSTFCIGRGIYWEQQRDFFATPIYKGKPSCIGAAEYVTIQKR